MPAPHAVVAEDLPEALPGQPAAAVVEEQLGQRDCGRGLGPCARRGSARSRPRRCRRAAPAAPCALARRPERSRGRAGPDRRSGRPARRRAARWRRGSRSSPGRAGRARSRCRATASSASISSALRAWGTVRHRLGDCRSAVGSAVHGPGADQEPEEAPDRRQRAGCRPRRQTRVAAGAQVVANRRPIQAVDPEALRAQPVRELAQVAAVGVACARAQVSLQRQVGEVVGDQIFDGCGHGSILSFQPPAGPLVQSKIKNRKLGVENRRLNRRDRFSEFRIPNSILPSITPLAGGTVEWWGPDGTNIRHVPYVMR